MLPVVEALAAELDVPLSVDTSQAQVMQAAVAAVARAMFNSTSRSMVSVRDGCRITSAPMVARVLEVSGNHMS